MVLDKECLLTTIVYKEMTCPPHFEKPKRDSYMERIPQNMPKKTPIRKDFYSKEKRSIFDYYKSPNTLTRQDTHNLPSLTL